MQTVTIEGPVMEKVVAALGQSPLFASLPPEHMGQVAQRATLQQYDDGETVMSAGEDSDSFFVMLSGEARVVIAGHSGEQIDVAQLTSPDSVGEMGLLLNAPRSASVVASSKALMMRFDAESFGVLYERVAGFGLTISKALAQRLQNSSRQIPLKNLDSGGAGGGSPEPGLLGMLPMAFIQRHRVVPVRQDGNVVMLGFVDDPNASVMGQARDQLSGMEVQPVRIDAAYFEKTLQSRAGVDEWTAKVERARVAEGGPAAAAPVEDDSTRRTSPRLDVLLRRMVAEGASDLHLSARQQPRWRIDGDVHVLQDTQALGDAEALELLRPVMRDHNIEEFASDNDSDFAYAIPGVARFRVNLFRDRGGVCAVFRQIPATILTLEQLNLPPVVTALCEHPKGLVLVTGPTGSGKSTTLAAMIDYINKKRRTHIITLEDPIEFVHESKMALVNQREVGPHTHSFSRALRAALREDPDIVLVGELRDLETVSLALETANTGHLVFGTLHTATAISTVDRIIDLFPADQQNQIRTVLADSLKGVIAQTLCKRKGGGRVAALEILVSNFAVANLIRESKIVQIASIMTTQKQAGNQLLNEELFKLIDNGTIDYDHALARAVDKNDLAKRCGKPPPPT